MMKHRPLAVAIALACGLTASPLVQALCRPDNVKPFQSSAADAPTHGFANTVTDSEGVSLVICTDSVTNDGNPPPCFFDPVVPGNAESERSGFGGEGFWFLSQNTIATTGANAIDALVVMATEAAYLAEVPNPGEQFSFTRLRIRIDVTQPGMYTVHHPWGSKQYIVDAVVDDRGRPIRREINDTTDIEFRPANSNNTGSVGPWLRWDTPLPAGYEGYIGDGQTPHSVTGSPCNQNFVRIEARALNGNPLAIDAADQDGDGRSDQITNRLFVVQGKLAPVQITPLVVEQSHYARSSAGNVSLNVFATAPSTASVIAEPGGTMLSAGDGYHFTAQSVASVPTSVTVKATGAMAASQPSTVTVPVTDMVNISRAQATCSGTPRTCSLAVDATSSDRSATAAPTLNLTYNGARLASGTVTVPGLRVLPSSVTVKSSAGGSATRPVTVVNN